MTHRKQSRIEYQKAENIYKSLRWTGYSKWIVRRVVRVYENTQNVNTPNVHAKLFLEKNSKKLTIHVA